MKFLVLFLGLFCIFSCPKLELMNASESSWVGGRFDSGKGTNYTVRLVAKKSSEKLHIDQMWLKKDSATFLYFPVKPQRQLKDFSITNEFAKNDTIYIQANRTQRPNEEGVMEEVVNAEYVNVPYVFEGEALIGYTWKGKRRYMEISGFDKKETVYYP